MFAGMGFSTTGAGVKWFGGDVCKRDGFRSSIQLLFSLELFAEITNQKAKDQNGYDVESFANQYEDNTSSRVFTRCRVSTRIS